MSNKKRSLLQLLVALLRLLRNKPNNLLLLRCRHCDRRRCSALVLRTLELVPRRPVLLLARRAAVARGPAAAAELELAAVCLAALS